MTDDLKNKFISRRQLIKAGGLTAAGVAGAALIGCGSDDEDAPAASSAASSSSSSSAATQAATATPTASGLTAAKTAVATQAAAADSGPKKRWPAHLGNTDSIRKLQGAIYIG